MRLLRLPALLLLSACVEPPAIEVSDAWVRAAPPGRQATAAYFVLSNKTDREMIVDSVSSPDIARLEMHETTMDDGVMRMRKITELVIPAGGRLELAPGGRHLMLFDDVLPAQGDRLVLIVRFADGSAVRFEAPVRRGGG